MNTKISFEKTGRRLRNRPIATWLWLGTIAVVLPILALAGDSRSYTFITLPNKSVPDASGLKTAAAEPVKPNSLTVDGLGNLYFTDARHQVICRMTSTGGITVIAGKWGMPGSADGLGSEARFHNPRGIARDATGNLYVADTSNDTIRRITPDGVATTLAGMAKASGNTDGVGKAARFNYPCGLAMDASGTLYVADLYNYVIRKVTPGGLVTTFAGQVGKSAGINGPAHKAGFDSPVGLAVDNYGNVYVADMNLNSIRKITAAGRVITLAGQLTFQPGHADGMGRAAQFFHPCGVAADEAGNIYVADSSNDLIRRIAPDGTVVTLAGVAGQPGDADGAGSRARFGDPFRIAVDGTGNLYVTDLDHGVIREGIFTPASKASLTLTGP
jgi:sugar lactone lactonase YvrE